MRDQLGVPTKTQETEEEIEAQGLKLLEPTFKINLLPNGVKV